jgi:tricorn protease
MRLLPLVLSPLFLFGQNFAEPSLAPNRSELYFSSGGDIWRAPLAGGEASLLISHPADDSRPLPSPNGKWLAFQSSRTGSGDIYLLDLETSALRRLTFDGSPEVINAWSADSNFLYFHSTSRDISGMNDIYRVAVAGGTPERVRADRYTNEFFAAPSPDGKSIVFCARGNAATQWWRHGHSHLDESELWLQKESLAPTKLVGRGAKHLWPMWSNDGKTIYYMSDEGGNENLWSLVPGQKPKALTSFTGGRLLWPTLHASGKLIAFERNFKIHTLDLATLKTQELAISLRGVPSTPVPERRVLSQGFSGLAVAPDGKKLAFIARGEIFASATRDAADAFRVTDSAGPEAGLHWSPDSMRLVYRTEQGSDVHLSVYDFKSRQQTKITSGSGVHSLPRWSPDGKSIAFLRNGTELMLWEEAAKSAKPLASARFGLPPLDNQYLPAWSPDSKWIAYLAKGEKSFRNVYVVPVSGGESRQISFLPNVNAAGVTWSPDGEAIYFSTSQRTEAASIVRIDLRIKAAALREDKFDDLFQAAPKKEAVKPVGIDFEGLRRRVTLLPLELDVNAFTLSPDGKTMVFSAQSGPQTQLYTVSIDPLRSAPLLPRQLTSTPGPKTNPQFSSDSKEVFFVEQGRLVATSLDTRTPRAISPTAELIVDFEKEKGELFSEAWSYLNAHFYDAKFHGTDWAATRERFERPAMASRSMDELRRTLNLMIGELNASHLGFSLAVTAPADSGRLGLDFGPPTAQGFPVSHVVPLGPAALSKVAAGSFLTAIDGKPLTPNSSIEELLEFKTGKKTTLTLDGKPVVLQPISIGAEKQLRYKEWVDASRSMVDKLSSGKLSYVHIPDMSEESLRQFYLDLDEEAHKRKGVVIDVRNNNGGFVNVYAIDVLARKSYFSMRERGESVATPNRTMLGQRALDLPTILLTNQHSLSDAEDFTEGYQFLKLGKTVGEPTAGWIIFTWNQTLFDGSTLRLPRMAITDTRGQNMERNPRPVDIAVERPIGDTGDAQIARAVSELLQQLR